MIGGLFRVVVPFSYYSRESTLKTFAMNGVKPENNERQITYATARPPPNGGVAC